METIFWVKPVKLENMNEKVFAPQNVPHTAKLSFCGDMKDFRKKLTKNFYWRSKNFLPLEKAMITQKVFFPNKFENGKILRNLKFHKVTISKYSESYFSQQVQKGQIRMKVFDIMATNIFGQTN